MTARFNIFKDKTESMEGMGYPNPGLTVAVPMSPVDNPRLPGDRKRSNLEVANEPNVIRGHHV